MSVNLEEKSFDEVYDHFNNLQKGKTVPFGNLDRMLALLERRFSHIPNFVERFRQRVKVDYAPSWEKEEENS